MAPRTACVCIFQGADECAVEDKHLGGLWEEGQPFWELPPHLLFLLQASFVWDWDVYPSLPSLCLRAGLLVAMATHTWGLELASPVRLAVHSDKSWEFQGEFSPCLWCLWHTCQPRTHPHWHHWYYGSGHSLSWGAILYIEGCWQYLWSLPTRDL